MAKIIINKGKPNERTVPLEFETTTVGRASDNVVVLPELYISRQHLIIEKRPGGYYAHNLSSTTGTLVNQQRVEEALLKSGDVIALGETTLHFELDPTDERTMIFEQQTVVMPAAPEAPPAPACPKCNSAVRAGDVFCGSCGAPVKAPAAAPPPSPRPSAPAPPVRESYSDPQLKVPMVPPAPPAPPGRVAAPVPPSAPGPPGVQPPPPPPPPRVPPVPPVASPPPRPAGAMPPRPPAAAAPRAVPGAANYLSYPKAGFGVRFIAYLIDSIILSVIGFILIGLPLIIFILPAMGAGMSRRGEAAAGALGILGILGMMVGIGLYTVIAVLYVLWFWAKKGYTPGKKMMGLRVITQSGECPLGWGPACMRFLGYIVNGMIANVGFLFILFDAEKRGLHDMIAKTYVVSIK